MADEYMPMNTCLKMGYLITKKKSLKEEEEEDLLLKLPCLLM